MNEPTPVKTEARICFGIEYFGTPAEADRFAKIVRARGDTYNGGYFDGMPCGRERRFDHVDPEHGPVYAVTCQ